MTMPQVTIPRTPTPTMTATTMRMILRALLPPLEGGAGGRVVGVTPGADGPAATTAPHLLQNFVPAFRVAPQELQNAISHLVGGGVSARRASIPQMRQSTQRWSGA